MSEWNLRYFFFPLWRKKKIQHYFSPRAKSRVISQQSCRFQTEKKQRYFSKLSTPIFLPKLWITDEKTKIIFWPKLGISDGNKKIPPYFCKNCLFLAEIKKYPLFLPKPSKSCAGKKNTATHEKEWVSAFSIFSREKKIRHLWCLVSENNFFLLPALRQN